MVILTKTGKPLSYLRGQSIFEVILALAIFGIIAASLGSFMVGGFRGLEQGGEQSEAEALASEGIDALRSIRDRAWNESVQYASGVVSQDGTKWTIASGASQTIGKFTRTISFADVCRDGTGAIVICPGSYTDVHTKQVSVTVSWLTRGGIANSLQKVAYLTNWDSKEWTEDTLADFSDGTFVNTATSASLGDLDGAVILLPQ